MKHTSLFKCPVCGEVLQQGEKEYSCDSGHAFDIARKGYVNLLLSRHIGKGDPGDDKEMIKNRKQFLNQGYYRQFSDELNKLVVAEVLGQKGGEGNILDAGCGEGYYITRLKDSLAILSRDISFEFYGTDVSKAAIQAAAGRDKEIRFAVASTFHLPLLPDSVDVILCIFAPRDGREFSRVLKAGGKLIVAAPGPRHLYGLRMALYYEPEPIGRRGDVEEGFRLEKTKNVAHEIHLQTTEDILSLLCMTPYSRHADERALERIRGLKQLSTEVDINLLVYKKWPETV